MSDKDNTPKNKPTKDSKPKKERNTYPRIEIPIFLFAKAEREGITTNQLLVYSWYWTKNHYFAGKGKVFGRPRLGLLDRMVEDDLRIARADICRIELVEKGWLRLAEPWQYEGKRQVGFLCMPDKSQADEARAQQQELHLQDEEAVVQVESSLPDTYEFKEFGIRRYFDSDGVKHDIPSAAPERPTPTSVWCNDPEGWYEPDDLPTHDLEY